MSVCKGENCTAEESNLYTHSPECLRDYGHCIDMDRVSVSLSQMKWWVEELEENSYFQERLIEDLKGYIDTKERLMNGDEL